MVVPETELDLRLCLRSGQVFRWHEDAQGVWRGADGPHWYRIFRSGDLLQVHSNADRSDFDRLFGLDLNAVECFEAMQTAGPELAPFLKAAIGLRPMHYAEPRECIFTFLCTANNHVARITAMVARLAHLGPLIEDSGEHAFPSLERLAELTEPELRAAGFGYRAKSLPEVARKLLERGGEEYIANLSKGRFEHARGELMELPGIGRKLADCIALFGLGFRESVPIDTHIWNVATRMYFTAYEGSPLTPYKYEEFSLFFRNRFGQRAGWAHQTLFLDDLVNWRSRKTASKRR